MTDTRYVTWGRWQAEHQALEARTTLLEERAETLRDAESIHTDLQNRLARLESQATDLVARGKIRRDRLWLLTLGLMTGIVCPLLTTALLIWLHLRAT